MAFLSAWPDLEASMFDPDTTLSAEHALSGLSCPLVLAANEVGNVRVNFVNPNTTRETFLVRSRISQGFLTLWREDRRPLSLAPGESRELSWPIRAGDAAYGRIVMVRILALRGSQLPARQASCGTLVAPWSGVPGRWLFVAPVLLGLTLVAAGSAWWWRAHPSPSERVRASARRGAWLLLVVLASLVAGVGGQWLPSHLLLILALLSAVISLEHSRLAGN